MALDDLLANMERRQAATPATPKDGRGVTARPAPIQACTPETPVTPRHNNDPKESGKVGAGGTAGEPCDRETWEERAAIAEFDGGLSREEAERLAWHEDDRRRCAECGNLTHVGVCRVAAPGAAVSANRGYRPDQSRLVRCAGFVGRRL
jgi:hypothetical protein